ncbi:MAG: SpoIIE family protein phosphatase [Clostridia bacterium]|nr:SpoIIE family protein phosphatase [Clostridia bacterium]
MTEFPKNGFSVFLHFVFLPAFFALSCLGNNAEPFALGLLFALLDCGLSPILSCSFYLFSSLPAFNLQLSLVFSAQTVLLALGFLLKDKLQEKKESVIFPFFALAISLALFVFFAPFELYSLPVFGSFLGSVLLQKAFISVLIFLFTAISVVGVRALLFKLLKCRLGKDELVFALFFLLLVGLGVARFLGVHAYLGISFLVLLIYSAVAKDCSTLFCAFLLSLPAYVVGGVPIERFFLYGVAVTATVGFGRLPAVFSLLCLLFIYAYFDGVFLLASNLLLPTLLSGLIPCLIFVLLPTPVLRAMENKLVFYREKHISRVAINRNRMAIGDRLFELSGVFREIQATFFALGTTEAEDSAKDFICRQTVGKVCANCPKYRTCLKQNQTLSLRKLVDVGCAKGKTNLIDVPVGLANVCDRQSDILSSINRLLVDYQKCMLEAENAQAGRALLAGQAQGVSEILKNLALDQSEPITIYSQKEKELTVALLRAGIVSSEILITGEDGDFILSVVTYGMVKAKKLGAVASAFFKTPMILSERISLSRDKYCCILKRRPNYDAAFGVAALTKYGEEKSGDTHSVIKIDERKFMVALSDGMGSGEYAKRISESTISLLESFYRAKMPSKTVLSTINKLLTFNKEETFACVDVAIVDLDTGRADIVKIGSPSGFILSGTSLKIVENATLPLGILESLHPVTATHVLEEDDVLLFLSDGITSAFGSTSDLYDSLKNVSVSNPQQLADDVLATALSAYGGKAMDDMTVLAVRLFKSA